MKKKIVNILLIVSMSIMVYFIILGIYAIINNAEALSKISYAEILKYHSNGILKSLIKNIVHSFLFSIVFILNLITLIFSNKKQN